MKKVIGYPKRVTTLNSKERRVRIKSSLIFCPSTGSYITLVEYREYLESLIGY